MEHLKQIGPMAMLVSFVGKTLFAGASPTELGVIACLVGYLIAKEMVERNKTFSEHKSMMETELRKVNEVVSEQNRVIKKMAEELDIQRTNVSALKLGHGMKKLG